MTSNAKAGQLYVLTTPSKTRVRSDQERAALERAIRANEQLKRARLAGRTQP